MDANELVPAIVGASLIAVTIGYVYAGLCYSRILAKAGRPGWEGWVPFLNAWRFLQMGGVPGWWVLVSLVPALGTLAYTVAQIVAGWRVQGGFGKPGAFFVLAILLTPVWYGILAFDSSTWSPTRTPLLPAAAAV